MDFLLKEFQSRPSKAVGYVDDIIMMTRGGANAWGKCLGQMPGGKYWGQMTGRD